jgi:hypothetical protein
MGMVVIVVVPMCVSGMTTMAAVVAVVAIRTIFWLEGF